MSVARSRGACGGAAGSAARRRRKRAARDGTRPAVGCGWAPLKSGGDRAALLNKADVCGPMRLVIKRPGTLNRNTKACLHESGSVRDVDSLGYRED